MENDRLVRTSSYTKDFKLLNLGTINLEKVRGQLRLHAVEIPGVQVMDFRKLIFVRKGMK